MSDVQKWICEGRLMEDAVLKYTATQYPILNFTLHSKRSYEVKGVTREENLTADCTVLGELGQKLAPQMKASVKLIVGGKWKLNEWTDQKTGQPRKRHVVTVDEVDVLGTTVLQIPEMRAQEPAPMDDGSSMPF